MKEPDYIERMLANDELVLAALQEAVRDALRQHKAAGNPIATWRDGKVVWIPAEEIEIPPEPPRRE